MTELCTARYSTCENLTERFIGGMNIENYYAKS